MTLRVTVEIVPHGDESSKYEIGRLNISNIGAADFGHHEYIVNEDRLNPGDTYFREGSTYQIIRHPNVFHRRNSGFWELIKRAIKDIDFRETTP